MKLFGTLGLVLAIFSSQVNADTLNEPNLNNGVDNVVWGSGIKDLGSHYYVQDASNLIYQVSHISEQCYIKEQDAQNQNNAKIYCYKNDKFTTSLQFKKGFSNYQSQKDYYKTVAVNPDASVRKDMLNEFVSYQVPTTHYDQLIVTVSYSKPRDMSLVIINNMAILKQNATPDEKPYLN